MVIDTFVNKFLVYSTKFYIKRFKNGFIDTFITISNNDLYILDLKEKNYSLISKIYNFFH